MPRANSQTFRQTQFTINTGRFPALRDALAKLQASDRNMAKVLCPVLEPALRKAEPGLFDADAKTEIPEITPPKNTK